MSVIVTAVRGRQRRPALLVVPIAAACMIAYPAFPALAQDGTGPVPQNAEARSYGGG